jgi:predicted ATPase
MDSIKSPTDIRMLQSLTLRNVLSFGPDTPTLELNALTVLIGPNGSGKSNLIDCVGLFQSAPEKLAETIRAEGSIREWLWKGDKNAVAHVEAVVANGSKMPLRHWFEFREANGRFELSDERIENAQPAPGKENSYLYFGYRNGNPMLMVGVKERKLQRETINPELSILSQRRDPEQYPVLTYLGDTYKRIRLYREWSFGRTNAARDWQSTAAPNDYLTPNADNMALMLSHLRGYPEVKNRLRELLDNLYEGITDIDVRVFGGQIQVYIQEQRGFLIPASRLSDGTLRFLSLLIILLHPEPPPLICIEEPELGLHPDAVVAIGKLIKEASTRTQLIVTTHSRTMIDAFQESPDDVVVVHKEDGATIMERLDATKLSGFLANYSLSNLWSSGDIGGNRWSN